MCPQFLLVGLELLNRAGHEPGCTLRHRPRPRWIHFLHRFRSRLVLPGFLFRHAFRSLNEVLFIPGRDLCNIWQFCVQSVPLLFFACQGRRLLHLRFFPLLLPPFFAFHPFRVRARKPLFLDFLRQGTRPEEPLGPGPFWRGIRKLPGALRVFGLHPPPPVALLKRTDPCKVNVLWRVVVGFGLLT